MKYDNLDYEFNTATGHLTLDVTSVNYGIQNVQNPILSRTLYISGNSQRGGTSFSTG